MAYFTNRSHGRTASPALIGLVVGFFFWLILALAGNDVVTNAQRVSSDTSAALLAVLKDFQGWVACGIGLLVFLWAWQMRSLESAEERRLQFLADSAELPQWKPLAEAGETAAFVVPLARVEAGQFQRRMPVPAAALRPVVSTRSVPVMRLAPLEEMAHRFAGGRMAGGLPLAVHRSGGGPLVRAARVEIPSGLGLATLVGMAHSEIERLAGEFYRRQGYDVAAIGEGREDSGVDLLLQRTGEVVVVKCVTGIGTEIPVDAARALLALVVSEGATRGVLLTTGAISRKAVKFARSKARGRLELINGRQFEVLLGAAAAGAGASPACPCCGGAMRLTLGHRIFGRSVPAWDCQAPGCDGMIREGDVPSRRLAA